MSDASRFADSARVHDIAQQLYPEAKITMVDRGYDNIVALIDQELVLRFPRNEAALVRSRYECDMLGKLDGIKAVAVPKLVAQHDDPPYLVTSFVPGQNVSPEFINGLSINEQQAIGATIGTFAYELHSSVSVKKKQRFENQRNWATSLMKLGSTTLPESWQAATLPCQNKLVLPSSITN